MNDIIFPDFSSQPVGFFFQNQQSKVKCQPFSEEFNSAAFFL